MAEMIFLWFIYAPVCIISSLEVLNERKKLTIIPPPPTVIYKSAKSDFIPPTLPLRHLVVTQCKENYQSVIVLILQRILVDSFHN